jgi:hypothetical protein
MSDPERKMKRNMIPDAEKNLRIAQAQTGLFGVKEIISA